MLPDIYPCKPDIFEATYDVALPTFTVKGSVDPLKLKELEESMRNGPVNKLMVIDSTDERVVALNELIDSAWGLIANAGGGDWDSEKPEWKAAAIRWREQYHASLDMGPYAKDGATLMAEAWNKKVERIHAQEKAAVESGWVELKDQPPPRERAELIPAWEKVIEDYRTMFADKVTCQYPDDPIALFNTQVVNAVLDDMRARDKTGRERYGVPLTAFNGRDQLIDAYQEALDLVVYLRAAMLEGITIPSVVYNDIINHLTFLRRMITSRPPRKS